MPYRPCPYELTRTLTIIHQTPSPDHVPGDPESLALGALGWVLQDDDRAGRLLALTGLTPEILRDRLTERSVMAAVLDFLANHEPDLVLAADALNVAPETLVAARRALAAGGEAGA
ncbi:DUF3572 domain-containing protein [Pelagerythrobacter marinus]|uniref:DUF3572 family protein n=1 Tax=Pelagerythrobacter marinus TaxID=538382 RepID=A0ABW9UV08_9SPHN|nr:DUF3572 domain-containing protein [Pelagerythrobacter marinus]MEC9065903.1 DUF3572 domain-containing protein [Pseudomonadota bacterium]MXO68696.1 DUF3572 family protein [Pelagerythrobacter marinus]WPZ06911.1 DUF3572 domain-containing protein [Pelagerythrobacter marinus]